MRRASHTDIERKKIIAEYRRSGTSVRAFAESHGISGTTLYQWLAAARRKPEVRVARVVRRASPITVTEASRLIVELDGVRLHVPAGFDAATLTTVIEILAARRA
jgi:transposase-like protein